MNTNTQPKGVQMVVNTQLARIHVLLHKSGLMAYKADMVTEVTNGREHSSKLLTHEEANVMIARLEATVKERQAKQKAQEPEQIMRRKIISCCREMGWIKGGKADMPRIYTWVLKYGYLHKSLNKYTAAELPRLVTQAENMKNDYLKSVSQ
jgi:hypothetical protein